MTAHRKTEPDYRCLAPGCRWKGPRSAAVHRAVGSHTRLECPRCLHGCRPQVLARRPSTRRVADPALVPADPAALAEFLARPRTCSRCHVAATNADFPVTTNRYGRHVVRGWCKRCLQRYYAAKWRAYRAERAARQKETA